MIFSVPFTTALIRALSKKHMGRVCVLPVTLGQRSGKIKQENTAQVQLNICCPWDVAQPWRICIF